MSGTTTIKLQKFLATAGIASRRRSEELISAKKVTINDKVAKIGDRVDPLKDIIKFNGKTVAIDQKHLYFLVYKPVGMISTTSDELSRDNVLSLIPADIRSKYRLFPVGRLDKDSEGLMLITNDGELTQKLTHPKYEIEKTYRVLLDRKPTFKAIMHLRKGVRLADGITKPAKVELKNDSDSEKDDPTWLEISISEGRNHQIRRMMERVGYQVKKLIRIKMGPFSLEQLGNKNFIEVERPNL